jgi:hypothetical protein
MMVKHENHPSHLNKWEEFSDNWIFEKLDRHFNTFLSSYAVHLNVETTNFIIVFFLKSVDISSIPLDTIVYFA